MGVRDSAATAYDTLYEDPAERLPRAPLRDPQDADPGALDLRALSFVQEWCGQEDSNLHGLPR